MFSGETTIYTLDDLSCPKRVSDLIKVASYPIEVFTMTDRVTVGHVDRIVPLGEFRTYKIVLDDDTLLRVTDSQKFVLLDGSTVTLSGLKIGNSLMPLYLGHDAHGYPTYRENSDFNLHGLTSVDCQKVRKVSRMVAEYKITDRLQPNTYVSHVDGNRKNCHTSNLTVVSRGTKGKVFVHPYVKALKEAQEFIKSVTTPRNHKIVSITLGDPENVFGLVSDRAENVAISGIFLRTTECE